MSTPQRQNPGEAWEEFFARTKNLPPPHVTQPFLKLLPQNAVALDFGAGSGRWTAAFLRDRPDLTIDVLDQHVDKALVLPPDIKGEKYHMSFGDFTPDKSYDGIWACDTLFFLKRDAQADIIHTLASALKPGGVMEFTMVDDCQTAQANRFTGMNKQAIEETLAKEHLKPLSIGLDENAAYGPNNQKIPTFLVLAQKA